MDHTSRMTALLARFRRERNGAVADTMQYQGRRYGLNFGVSIPTVRTIARAETPDHEWAQFLYGQDVRELRLAALWIADPERIELEEIPFWGRGVNNTEMAEEAAFALMKRTPVAESWGLAWCDSDDELWQYAGLLGLSNLDHIDLDRIFRTVGHLIERKPESPLIGRGVVALLFSLIEDPEQRHEVETLLSSLNDCYTTHYVREEMSWRLEF